jgi:C-terminal processing protease CtpA/Prc
MNLRLSCLALSLVLAAVGSALAADLDAQTKTQTVDALFSAMRKVYVFPEKAEEAERTIRTRLREGAYDGAREGAEFARLVTEDLNRVCKDAHLRVRYSEEVLPTRREASEPSPAEIEAYRREVRMRNASFQRVERLPGNVGYIKFDNFTDPEAAARPIRAAMEFVADTDALIFDIRENGGGDPATVRLLCSYLFGETPVHLNDIYFRPENRTTQFWTLRKVDGRRYLNKEVYILTSKRTGSGAEEFAYNLKNLRRGLVVGTTTWGGANPGGVVRLNDHFSAFVPSGRAINPITKTNWEGTGVEPDVHVEPEQALKTAHALAIRRLLAKATRAEDKERLERVLADVEK